MKLKQRKALVCAFLFTAFTAHATVQACQGVDAKTSQILMLATGVIYIGGNLLDLFIKSKFFRSELVGK